MSYYDCRHGEEMCDQCLDTLNEGRNQGRKEERDEILEALIDADALYDFHSNCRLCEAIALINGGN